MKTSLLLSITAMLLFFSSPLSAQSKKELQLENQMLKLSNADLQLKIDSCNFEGLLLIEQLEKKTSESNELAHIILIYEAEFLTMSDSSKIDSGEVDRAIAWNDTIVHDQKKMLDLESDFVNTIVDGEAIPNIEKAFEAYKLFLYDVQNKYNNIAPFDGPDTFRKAMIELLNEFVAVAENEYTEMIKIYSKDEDALTETDFDRWEVLTNVVDEKESLANDLFLLRQKIFTLEYHFTLQY